jgi:RND family efflux transporter MFP subunit
MLTGSGSARLEPNAAGATSVETPTAILPLGGGGGDRARARDVGPRREPTLDPAALRAGAGADLDFARALVDLRARRGQASAAAQPQEQRPARHAQVLELLATSLSHDHFADAATAFSTEIATLLGCDRAALGFVNARRVKVEALSHNTDVRQNQAAIRDLACAMDECLDQAATLVYPQPANAKPRITQAHADLLRRTGNTSVCSVPLVKSGEVFGVLTVERRSNASFDTDTVALCEHVACLVGPVLELKRTQDRPLAAKLAAAGRGFVGRLFGPHHITLKVVGATLAAAAFGLCVIHGDYRVSAPARVEGSVQRALVAPTEGFIKQTHVRPGDLVKKDQLLAELADEDLKLEQRKWAAEVAQYENAYGEALAKQDRAQIVMAQARIDEAHAQLALVEEQLARVQIKAPFDGVIIKGDLTQSLGAPVKRGDVLLTLAPKNEYRVIVEVDERDVGDLKQGQHGRLALAAAPQQPLPVGVRRITPVANTAEGRHYFEVEAQLEATLDSLRPGLKGVAKIDVDQRSLAWIWGHRALDWLRLSVWSWIGY